jgi:hypothetical protein
MGHTPSDDDMYAIILGSLPPSYDSYISAISATSRIIGTFISADALMATVTDEYEHRLLNAKGGKKDENVAFSSNAGPSKGRKAKKDIECFNCHKKGHYKSECWAEGGGKEGEGLKGMAKRKAKEVLAAPAVAAKAKAAEDKVEAWMVSVDDVEASSTSGNGSLLGDFDFIDDLLKDMCSLPDLWSVSDTDRKMDLAITYQSFDDDELNALDFEDESNPTPLNDPEIYSEPDNDLDTLPEKLEFISIHEEEAYTTYEASMLQGAPGMFSMDVDLYDSGA